MEQFRQFEAKLAEEKAQKASQPQDAQTTQGTEVPKAEEKKSATATAS